MNNEEDRGEGGTLGSRNGKKKNWKQGLADQEEQGEGLWRYIFYLSTILRTVQWREGQQRQMGDIWT